MVRHCPETHHLPPGKRAESLRSGRVQDPGATVEVGSHLRDHDGHDFEVPLQATLGVPLNCGQRHTNDGASNVGSHLDHQHAERVSVRVKVIQSAKTADTVDRHDSLTKSLAGVVPARDLVIFVKVNVPVRAVVDDERTIVVVVVHLGTHLKDILNDILAHVSSPQRRIRQGSVGHTIREVRVTVHRTWRTVIGTVPVGHAKLGADRRLLDGFTDPPRRHLRLGEVHAGIAVAADTLTTTGEPEVAVGDRQGQALQSVLRTIASAFRQAVHVHDGFSEVIDRLVLEYGSIESVEAAEWIGSRQVRPSTHTGSSNPDQSAVQDLPLIFAKSGDVLDGHLNAHVRDFFQGPLFVNGFVPPRLGIVPLASGVDRHALTPVLINVRAEQAGIESKTVRHLGDLAVGDTVENEILRQHLLGFLTGD